MSETEVPPEEITLDDIRRKAEGVRDIAVSQAKETVSEVTGENRTRIIIAAAVGVGLLMSLAYFVGSRAGKAEAYDALEDFGRAYD